MTETTLVIGNKTYSSWSLRGWLMAKRAGLVFSEHKLSMDTPEFARDIVDLSPSGRVPVLRHEGLVIWDSLAIGEYLAERCPDAGLWPEAAAERARARSISAEMHAGFESLRAALPFNCRASGRRVRVDAATQKDIDRIAAIWRDCLAAKSAAGPWLFGNFTIADAMYLPVALRFVTYGIELDDAAAGYVATCNADERVRGWRAEAQRESEVIPGEEVGVVAEP